MQQNQHKLNQGNPIQLKSFFDQQIELIKMKLNFGKQYLQDCYNQVIQEIQQLRDNQISEFQKIETEIEDILKNNLLQQKSQEFQFYKIQNQLSSQFSIMTSNLIKIILENTGKIDELYLKIKSDNKQQRQLDYEVKKYQIDKDNKSEYEDIQYKKLDSIFPFDIKEDEKHQLHIEYKIQKDYLPLKLKDFQKEDEQMKINLIKQFLFLLIELKKNEIQIQDNLQQYLYINKHANKIKMVIYYTYQITDKNLIYKTKSYLSSSLLGNKNQQSQIPQNESCHFYQSLLDFCNKLSINEHRNLQFILTQLQYSQNLSISQLFSFYDQMLSIREEKDDLTFLQVNCKINIRNGLEYCIFHNLKVKYKVLNEYYCKIGILEQKHLSDQNVQNRLKEHESEEQSFIKNDYYFNQQFNQTRDKVLNTYQKIEDQQLVIKFLEQLSKLKYELNDNYFIN